MPQMLILVDLVGIHFATLNDRGHVPHGSKADAALIFHPQTLLKMTGMDAAAPTVIRHH